MRIRQVRPEFWTDETMAGLPPAVRLFYVGLWNIADDAGWLAWRTAHIGAVLFPYESPKRRERDILVWAGQLMECGRLVVHTCGCAQIPTLSKHQRITGKQSFGALEDHRKHKALTDKQSPLSDSPVTLGNVKERNGMSPAELFELRDREDEADREQARAARHLRGVS